MSLVILSNTQDEYIRKNNNEFVVATGNGVSSPQSFINHFRSPLVIEPNSEVAVESVKINKAPTFDLDDSNLFYLYYGRELVNVNACESTKEPVPITIPRGSYTVTAMADALETAINRSSMNPEVWNKYKVTVNLNASSNNSFQNFVINQVSNTTTAPDITWAGTADELVAANLVTNASNYAWDGSDFLKASDVNASNTQNDCSVIMPKYPLSSCSGVFEVSFADTSGFWDIGLSRNTVANYFNGQPPNINVNIRGDKESEPFYDYVVKWDGAYIKLYHAVTGGDRNPNKTEINIDEIEYYNNTGSAPYFTALIDAAKISASGLDSVRFTLYGNALEVSVGAAGGTFYPLASPINTNLNNNDRRYNCKPTNNATECLFPKMALYTIADFLVLTTFNGLDQAGWITPENISGGRFTPGSDWYSNQVLINPRRIRFIDGRDACRPYNASDTTYSYSLLNASNSPDYNMVLITGPERDLTTNSQTDITLTETYVIGFGDARRGNMSGVLGSGPLSVLEQSVYGTGNLNSIFLTPPQKSEFMTHSGFVRVNNLTGVSYNGAKGSISKILYQIPRFDNSGATEGNLYHAPGEKTYIELGNTESMILNQLDVDIVDKSERVVNDLVGSTVVVLYIRKVR